MITPAVYDNMPQDGYEQGDFDTGEKELVKLAEDNSKRAMQVSKTQYWSAIDSVKSIYGTFETSPTSKDDAESSKFELRVNDVADQVDEMFAICKNLLAGREKRRMIPIRKNKADEKQVSITQKAQDALLRERDFDNEVALALMRFIKYNFGGMKVCRTRRLSNKNERVEIPAVGFSYRELLMEGYSMEQVESGFAVRHKCAKANLRFQGFADEEPYPDSNGFPVYTKLMCIKTTQCWDDSVYGRAIDPRRLGVYDINRSLDRQSSLHEYHYLSSDEVKTAYPYNYRKFKEKATAVPASQQQPGGSVVGNTAGGAGSSDFPIFEVTETWMNVDFEELLETGKITEKTILSLSEQFCIPYDEFFVAGKWQIVHWKDQCVLDLVPNYMWDRDEYPYDIESYIYQEERFCDKGMVHRISSTCAGIHKVRNLIFRNIRRMLNQSRIISKRLGLTDDDMEQLEQENGNVWAQGQAVDLAADIQFHIPPDTTPAGFNLLGMLESDKQQVGVSDTMAGNDTSDTATQAQINQHRGQIIANEAFGRFVGMVMRFYKKHLGAMLATITRGRLIKALGEDGTALEETWITPSDLTDRVEIIPMVSFSDTQDQQKAQFLLGMVNVFAPFSQPQEIIAMKNLIFKLGGLTKDEIDEINGAIGTYTDVANEIQAMLDDPSIQPEVRMDDIHEMCVAMGTAALQQKLDEYKMMGVEPNLLRFKNIMEYIQAHQAMQAKMEMAAKLMTPAPTKGKPKNEPSEKGADGGDGKKEARKSGQEASPADKGQETNAGFTGAGSQP